MFFFQNLLILSPLRLPQAAHAAHHSNEEQRALRKAIAKAKNGEIRQDDLFLNDFVGIGVCEPRIDYWEHIQSLLEGEWKIQ